tara:strand:- start:18933 stop:19151 length:219 start_codon:yes stop_codon:yes gene_type:complete
MIHTKEIKIFGLPLAKIKFNKNIKDNYRAIIIKLFNILGFRLGFYENFISFTIRFGKLETSLILGIKKRWIV